LARRVHTGDAKPVAARDLALTSREAPISTRTALVGGGSSGIGYASAERLLLAGHRVVISGRRADALDRAAAALRERTGGRAHTLVTDIRDPQAAKTAVSAVEAAHGALDVLVLNAGGPAPGRITDLDDEAWQDAFELLLLGPLRLARRALPPMAARGFGRVVLVTSTAVRQPQPDLAASVVLRSAMTSAAKLLSREFADHGVTVNCVAPGPTATDRRQQILSARAARTGRTFEDEDGADTATVPAGRAGRPAEIGEAIAFLASAAASYVNGTVLTVDGGRTETI
jgi:3-oxoacyl-[acyl-carrier protein] reductase